MSDRYIPITDNNLKVIKNFIGLCRMNGLEGPGEPNFTFKENREGIGNIIFDLFFRNNGVSEACWCMTVKTDTPIRFHDNVPAKKGDIHCYLDSYTIAAGSLELTHKTSKFNIFSF